MSVLSRFYSSIANPFWPSILVYKTTRIHNRTKELDKDLLAQYMYNLSPLSCILESSEQTETKTVGIDFV